MHGKTIGHERTHCRLCQKKLHDILTKAMIYADLLEMKFTEVKCIVHSFCCEAAHVALRPFLVKKLLPKLILEISQPRTKAGKIRYIFLNVYLVFKSCRSCILCF